MKHKTSITLSEEILAGMNRVEGRFKNRSELAETAIRELLARLEREDSDARDLKIINKYASTLNDEAEDVLAYQVSP